MFGGHVDDVGRGSAANLIRALRVLVGGNGRRPRGAPLAAAANRSREHCSDESGYELNAYSSASESQGLPRP